jgi:transcriptional regulator with XRE-family HTH domain
MAKKAAETITDKRQLAIAQKIKLLRLEKGYTSYEQFAWDNEINRVQYWRIEKGSNITIASLLKVLDIHKVSLKEFFSDIE